MSLPPLSPDAQSRLDALEGEATRLRHDIAEYLSMANRASLTLVSFGRRLGRLEDRIDVARAELIEAAAGLYQDRHEGSFEAPAPSSDCPPTIPDRLS